MIDFYSIVKRNYNTMVTGHRKSHEDGGHVKVVFDIHAHHVHVGWSITISLVLG